MSRLSNLKEFMPSIVRRELGDLPTTHLNCRAACEKAGILPVSRPGKTARDKANGMIPYRKNRRIEDPKTGVWSKV
jgi:hypothetical protein